MNLQRAEIALETMAQSLDAMASELKTTEKSIASVARKFQASLRAIVLSGSVSLPQVRQIVKDGIENAYIEGMIEGGLTAEDITADDAQLIDELNLTQQDFVPDFVKAIRDAKGGKQAQREIIDNRIPLWTASIEAAGAMGLAQAQKKEMVTWRYDGGEHCDTCRKLNGQRHSRKWFADRNYFPGMPGAAMDCGGYNCKCTLE